MSKFPGLVVAIKKILRLSGGFGSEGSEGVQARFQSRYRLKWRVGFSGADLLLRKHVSIGSV